MKKRGFSADQIIGKMRNELYCVTNDLLMDLAQIRLGDGRFIGSQDIRDS